MIQTSKKNLPTELDLDFNDLDLSQLTTQEQEEFKYLLAEAISRNLEIPVEKFDRKQYVFPKTPKGYFYKIDGTEFAPVSKAQNDFVNSNARYVLYYGSRGSGKTASGAQKAMKKISEGQTGIVINPTFEDFKANTWEEFRKWIPPDTVIPPHRYMLSSHWQPSRPFTLGFMNGAKVTCKGLKDPNSARGPNVNWLWYDEGGSDVTGDSWRIAIAAVRVGIDPQAWVTTTPNGIMHWLYDFFLSEEKQEMIESILEEFGEDLGDRKIVEYFHGTMEDNKINLDSGFYASMKTAYQGWQGQQEIEGLFVTQGGALGDSSWFNGRKLDRIPEDIKIRNRVRYWDLAASEKKIVAGRKMNDPDRTVGTLFSYATRRENERQKENALDQLPFYKGKDVFFIEDQVGGYWKWKDIKDKIWETALKDGYYVKIRVEQEPGSGGINQVEELKSFIQEKCKEHNMPVFDIDGNKPEGDKVQRANIWFAEAREGLFYIISGMWNTMFFRILDSFPAGTHDDEVDSVSGARITCAPIKVWNKIDFISL